MLGTRRVSSDSRSKVAGCARAVGRVRLGRDAALLVARRQVVFVRVRGSFGSVVGVGMRGGCRYKLRCDSRDNRHFNLQIQPFGTENQARQKKIKGIVDIKTREERKKRKKRQGRVRQFPSYPRSWRAMATSSPPPPPPNNQFRTRAKLAAKSLGGRSWLPAAPGRPPAAE